METQRGHWSIAILKFSQATVGLGPTAAQNRLAMALGPLIEVLGLSSDFFHH